jgi:hypothetical protein
MEVGVRFALVCMLRAAVTIWTRVIRTVGGVDLGKTGKASWQWKRLDFPLLVGLVTSSELGTKGTPTVEDKRSNPVGSHAAPGSVVVGGENVSRVAPRCVHLPVDRPQADTSSSDFVQPWDFRGGSVTHFRNGLQKESSETDGRNIGLGESTFSAPLSSPSHLGIAQHEVDTFAVRRCPGMAHMPERIRKKQSAAAPA